MNSFYLFFAGGRLTFKVKVQLYITLSPLIHTIIYFNTFIFIFDNEIYIIYMYIYIYTQNVFIFLISFDYILYLYFIFTYN